MAGASTGIQAFNPPQKLRDEIDLLNEYLVRLKNEVKLPDIYTLDGFIAKVEAILAEAKKEAAFRKAQKAIPYDPQDD